MKWFRWFRDTTERLSLLSLQSSRVRHDVDEIRKLVQAQTRAIATLNEGIFNVRHLEELIMADLTELTAAVEKEITVEQSAITLLNGLKAALDAAGTDPVALKALSEKIGASSDALAAAIAANTPAAPPAPPAPPA